MKDLSVIIPVLNPDEQFVDRLMHASSTFFSWNLEFEIIAVSDGISWSESLLRRCEGNKNFLALALQTHRGKFGAIKHGMAAATGRCRVFTDADLPYGLDVIKYIHHLVSNRGYHVVFGDRTLPDSEYSVHLSALRSFSTRAFSFLVRTLITGGLFDTQCGVKGFNGEVASALFPLVTHDGFAGDVETLYIALKHNLEMRRIPVKLQRSGPSSVSVFRDGFTMLAALPSFRRNWTRGVYSSAELARIGAQNY